MRIIVAALALLVAACTSPRGEAGSGNLDAIARDYVALILEIGEHEPGYVDAYYGPPEWAEAAKAETRTPVQLIAAAEALTARLEAEPTRGRDAAVVQRRAYLLAHVAAAHARLKMLSGERFSFADEAEALFGVRPELRPLTEFDPIVAEVEALLPGDAPLADRVAAAVARYVIPRDRLEPVIAAAIAECRRRTAARMSLPEGESFTLEYVGDKPWSAYNWYKGGAVSLIQVNAGLPITIDRAVDWGCHEGYPGHHVYNALLEQTFVRERGWVEMSVYPLFSPMSFIAEGTANAGIELAFPGAEKTAFEREVLYPLAGLNPALAGEMEQFLALRRRLAYAEYTIADDYLAGRADVPTTVERLMRYQLMTRDRAEQRVRFIDTYRSYVVNYGLGRDVAEAWIARQGDDPWAAMQTLLSSQILPVDLIEK